MSFTGTLDKCKACDKTVYFIDLLSADGVNYHKACFRCSHCNGTLVMSNYSSMDGVLYCKTHFEQLFKESGNFSKNFQTSKPERDSSMTRAPTPNKLSSLFCGTQDKCRACNKTVYPLEKMTMEGEPYHKSCFKCAHGGCPLTHSSYAALDGVLYCKHHFAQLFMEKGTYSHVLEAANKKNVASSSEEQQEQDEQQEEQKQEHEHEYKQEQPEEEDGVATNNKVVDDKDVNDSQPEPPTEDEAEQPKAEEEKEQSNTD